MGVFLGSTLEFYYPYALPDLPCFIIRSLWNMFGSKKKFQISGKTTWTS